MRPFDLCGTAIKQYAREMAAKFEAEELAKNCLTTSTENEETEGKETCAQPNDQ